MKMIEIQNHLRTVIPTLDDNFNSKIDISSASISSGKYNINAVAHGFEVGDTVIISEVLYVHEVTLLNKPFPLTASMVSAKEIDFWKNENDTILLRSNEASYNGIFDLKSTNDNRLNFEIKVPSTAPDTTAEAINVVEENLCKYNNEFVVSEVADADNFSIDSNAPDTTSLEGGKVYNVVDNVRINATVDVQHVIDDVKQYEAKGSWLFIESSASSVSRDRQLKTDAPQRLEQGMDIQIDSWGNFSVFAIINTGGSIDPVEIQDYCRNELKVSLLKSLLGYKPESTTTAEYDYIYYDGDSLLTYNKATYIHQYNFGCTIKINSDDAFKPQTCLVNAVETDYLKDEDVKASDLVTFTND